MVGGAFGRPYGRMGKDVAQCRPRPRLGGFLSSDGAALAISEGRFLARNAAIVDDEHAQLDAELHARLRVASPVMNEKGLLCLVLHAHLPYVRHPEYEDFLEEDWLFEAITETYLPLLDMMSRLVTEKVNFRLTMSLTPPLC